MRAEESKRESEGGAEGERDIGREKTAQAQQEGDRKRERENQGEGGRERLAPPPSGRLQNCLARNLHLSLPTWQPNRYDLTRPRPTLYPTWPDLVKERVIGRCKRGREKVI